MDWNDLRDVLAIAEAGSLAGAARALGVNHSTMYRRLGAAEERLGARLFERLADGYVPTTAGEEVAATACRLAQDIDALGRRLAGQDLQLSGPITVATSDTLAGRFLGPHIAAFKRRHPAIDLALVLDTQFANLTRRDADVAIRPTLAPPETLVGRRLAHIAFAAYATSDYLSAAPADADIGEHAWLCVDESLGHLSAARWQRDHVPAAAVELSANNLVALMGAAEAGMGVALLPCFMGDPAPGLQRVPGIPLLAEASQLWLLTHRDLRRSARIKAFMAAMADSIAGDRDLLEGRRG